MPKVISIKTEILMRLLSYFTDINEFCEYSGLKRIGTRFLNIDNRKIQLFLFKVLDEKKLSFSKIKYEF